MVKKTHGYGSRLGTPIPELDAKVSPNLRRAAQVYDWLIGQRCMVGADTVCFTDAVPGWEDGGNPAGCANGAF